MTPKTMKSSGNPTNRAQIERGLSGLRCGFCAFNTALELSYSRPPKTACEWHGGL